MICSIASYAVIATGHASCPKLECARPGCGTFFCYNCKQNWHPDQTCDAARAERSAIDPSLYPDPSKERGSQSKILMYLLCLVVLFHVHSKGFYWLVWVYFSFTAMQMQQPLCITYVT